ncbi:MAG: catalase [Ruminococcaceae bacterium]|nr:catalase [Oscillospiraceae bacterium]
MNMIGHFMTITRHRHEVIRHCKKAGILWQGLFHDLSKYTPSEFICGIRYYQGDRSPNDMERRAKGYSSAWMHHKGRNRHHFEYWTDYNPETGRYGPVKMPMRYVKEMFCDRLAASKIYQGDKYNESHPIEYFEKGRKNRLIHPETSDFLEKLLIMVRDEGEEATFDYIRKLEDY